MLLHEKKERKKKMISECNFANGSIDDIEVIIIFKALTSLIKKATLPDYV